MKNEKLDRRLVIREDEKREFFRRDATINGKRMHTESKYRGRDREEALIAIQEKSLN